MFPRKNDGLDKILYEIRYDKPMTFDRKCVTITGLSGKECRHIIVDEFMTKEYDVVNILNDMIRRADKHVS